MELYPCLLPAVSKLILSDLSYNKLSGTVPSSLSVLTGIRDLHDLSIRLALSLTLAQLPPQQPADRRDSCLPGQLLHARRSVRHHQRSPIQLLILAQVSLRQPVLRHHPCHPGPSLRPQAAVRFSHHFSSLIHLTLPSGASTRTSSLARSPRSSLSSPKFRSCAHNLRRSL